MVYRGGCVAESAAPPRMMVRLGSPRRQGARKERCEQNVPTEPDDIVTLLISVGEDYGRVGIEAAPCRNGWSPL